MRAPFGLALIITIVLSSVYIYREVETVCNIPLTYRLGELDERFGISTEKAKSEILEAEKVWEETVGKELFVYNPEADFTINFIYDDRQAFSDAEIDFRQRLDASEGVSSAIGETYEALLNRYEKLEQEYKNKVDSYERRLAQYNQKVAEYNQAGGAPPEAYEQLEVDRSNLDVELETVNDMGQKLNELVRQINETGERGNELIRTYNDRVAEYNDQFGEAREFTQGDYRGGEINIYKFANDTELRLVLAHELGHAMSLGHVENEASIMYHHLGGQPEDLVPSEEDLAEFERVCSASATSFWQRLLIRFGLQ